MTPLVVQKARRRPAYIDVTAPKPARDDHAIAARRESAFTRAFMRLARSVFDDATRKRLISRLEDPAATVEDAVNELEWFNEADPLSVKRWELYADSLDRAYTNVVEDAGNAALRELKLDKQIRFTVQKAEVDLSVPVNPFSAKWIRERVGNHIVTISDQQKSLVRQIIIFGLERGQRADEIADVIGGAVGLTNRFAQAVETRRQTILETGASELTARKGANKYANELLTVRGRNIARTETRDAMSQGQINSWQLAQDEGALPRTAQKQWVSMPESPRLSNICRELDGQIAGLNDPFDSSIVGAVMRPPAHPSCRSVMILVS